MSKHPKTPSVYIHQNKVNLKIYVGYSGEPIERWRSAKSVANNPNHKQYMEPFYCAIRKYGWDGFTHQVIETFDTKAEGLEAEKFWIEFFRSNRRKYGPECGYNLHEGGNMPPGVKGMKFNRTKPSWKKGMKMNAEYCQRMKDLRGPLSNETKRNISIGKTGKPSKARLLTPEQGAEVLAKHRAGQSMASLAKEYNAQYNSLKLFIPSNEVKVSSKKRLTAEQEQDIAIKFREGQGTYSLGTEYGVTNKVIRRIIKNEVQRSVLQTTPEQDQEIFVKFQAGETQSSLMKKYGLSKKVIQRIRKNAGKPNT